MKDFFKSIFGIKEMPEPRFIRLPANEIEIIMGNPNTVPFVRLGGNEIRGIIDIHYNYSTKTAKSTGEHNYTIKYIDENNNAIRVLLVNKIWEGREGNE